MAVAKAVKGRESFEASEVSGFIAAARDAMQQRGKADLGGKTVGVAGADLVQDLLYHGRPPQQVR